MQGIFKNPVNKAVDGLTKHLRDVLTDDEDAKNKAIVKLSDDISAIHFILYGDSDRDPNPEHISKLVPKLLDPKDDLFCKLAQYTALFEFEAKKQTAGIMNYIIRRCGKNSAAQYIRKKTKKGGSNIIIDSLLLGYHDQHLAQNVGSVLQEMAKRSELAPMLLNDIRISRDASDGKEDSSETRDVISELFVLVRKPSFDIASDAYKTLQLLLTRNKQMVPAYLNKHYARFFEKFNELIQSDNYVTQRQFLNLLSELLLEKSNFQIMIKYIGEKENLKIAMTLLKNSSNAISHEAFHIFKVFVANPKKERDIHIVLWKNKDKLISFLQSFLTDKAKEDEAFNDEKQIVIKHLRELPIPKEIEMHRNKQRAKSQQVLLTENDHSNSEKLRSKSTQNVNIEANDGGNNNNNNKNNKNGNDSEKGKQDGEQQSVMVNDAVEPDQNNKANANVKNDDNNNNNNDVNVAVVAQELEVDNNRSEENLIQQRDQVQ